MAEFSNKQEATREDIDSVALTIGELERTTFRIDIRPLEIDEYIDVSEVKEFDLSSLPSAYRTIDCCYEGCKSLASSDRFLLMDQYRNICLFDRELKLIKQSPWIHGIIYDMCWSSTLNHFIVINQSGAVLLIDENSMSIEYVETISVQNWWSCTCSETSLFLLTNEITSSIMEFNLLPSMQLVNQWPEPDKCTRDESIEDINFNHGTIALIIHNETQNAIHLELRSSDKFDQL
jgi:hypothetical protein